MAESKLRVVRYAKSRIAPLLVNPLVGRGVRSLARKPLDFHGVQVDLTDPAVTSRVAAALVFRTYESAEIRYAKRFLRGYSGTVIELGSSLGIVSAVIGKTIEDGSRLICVEANPRLSDRLHAFLRANVPTSIAVEVSSAAISATNGDILFVISTDTTASRLAEPEEVRGAVPVRGLPLEQLLADHQVAGPYAMVADIEGAEAFFISAPSASGLENCERLIIELHAVGDKPGNLETLATCLEERWSFHTLARYGNVLVADKAVDHNG